MSAFAKLPMIKQSLHGVPQVQFQCLLFFPLSFLELKIEG